MAATSHSLKPKLYSCNERQVLSIPSSEFVGKDGRVLLFQEVVSRGYFDVDFRNGKVVLVAGKFVGLIPLNESLVVEVLPKTKLSDFARMLDIAGEDPGSLHFFEREYAEKDGADRFFPLLVKSLVQRLQSVSQEGILKTYASKGNLHTFKPTIRFSKTLQRVWAKGDFSHSYSEVFEFTKDTSLNRLIKYALWVCGRYLASQAKANTLAQDIEFYSNLFEVVPLDLNLTFLADAEEIVRSGQLPVARQYYLDIARVCLLIARNRSIVPDSSEGSTRLLSFVINLEDVFEKYVRNTLKVSAKKDHPGMSVRNGNAEGKSYLFHDSRTAEIKPDVVVVRGGVPCLVLDVKYKPKTTEADRYQIISHATAMGVPIAVSVLPANDDHTGLIRRGQVHNDTGVEVFEYYMPLENNLAEHETRMAADILGLLE